MEIRPITFREAKLFNAEHHRHHPEIQGCKFCISCWHQEKLVGVAICGRPVSRHLDDNQTCEINRLCTDGTFNACSMLYGAACRVAKAMGYKRVITYTLESEHGASLKASNFLYGGQAGGRYWTGKRSKKEHKEQEMKSFWYRDLV